MKFRKAGSLFLALALAASIGASAFAAEDPTKDVTGSYTGGTGSHEHVYSYQYNFGSMEFTYDAGSAAGAKWNPSTHAYDGEMGTGSEAGWRISKGANDITVVNHSNAPIQVQLSFDATYSGFKGAFSKNNFQIASAEGTAVSEAPSETVQFGPATGSGVLKAGDSGVKLGTITLHVAGA